MQQNLAVLLRQILLSFIVLAPEYEGRDTSFGGVWRCLLAERRGAKNWKIIFD